MLTEDREEIAACYRRFPWLERHISRSGVGAFNYAVADNRLLDRYPHSSVQDGHFAEKVLIVSSDGKLLCKVGRMPGFKWWKFWLWIGFDERIGQALLRQESAGAAYIITGFDGYAKIGYHVGIYYAPDGKDLWQLAFACSKVRAALEARYDEKVGRSAPSLLG